MLCLQCKLYIMHSVQIVVINNVQQPVDTAAGYCIVLSIKYSTSKELLIQLHQTINFICLNCSFELGSITIQKLEYS